MKKRLLALLLILAMLTAMVPAAAAAGFPFTDVKEDDWFYEHVEFVWSKGYFEGVTDTEFDPQGTMTRAMFVTVLARLDGAKVDDTVSAFDDVPVNTWYTGSVAWAAKNKIVDGVAEGKFAPNDPVTREQMCAIMNRYIDYYGAANRISHEKGALVKTFIDLDKISAWASESVENCRVYGLIDGFEDGSFRPAETSTRAQVAAVISRLAWAVKGGGGGGGGSTGGGTKKYYVEFDPNGGIGTMEKQTFTVGTAKNLSVNTFTREGYVFVGWNTKADGTGTSYTDGQKVKNLSTKSGAVVTLYAQWQAGTATAYTVKHYQQNILDDNYTEVIGDEQQLFGVTNGTTAAIANTYTGFTAKPIVQQSIKADGSTVVKVYYDRNVYNANWDVDGTITSVPYRYEAEIAKASAPSKNGYTFAVWAGYTDGMKMGDADVTFTAQWNIITYDIAYNLNGGTVAAANPTTYTIESAAITLNNPTKTGYNFTGWTGTDLSGLTMNVTIPNGSFGDRAYEANWAPITYTVKFDANGGAGTMADQLFYYDAPQALTANAFTKSGYAFIGWNTKADGTGTDYNDAQIISNLTTTDGAVITLYAVWADATTTAQYTVEHWLQNVEGTDYVLEDSDSQTGTIGDLTNAQANAYTGFTAQTIAQQTILADGSTVVKVYYDRNTYYANWDVDGVITSVGYRYGAVIELPTVNTDKTGYEFTSWSGYTAGMTMDVGGFTFTAQWEPIEYTITYNLDGGSVAVANPVTYTIESAPIYLTNPTKTGCEFTGWTGTGLSGLTMNVTIPTGSTGDRAYTANWDTLIYTLTYETNGGMPIGGDNVDYFEHGALAPAPEDPYYKDHVFKGWYWDNGFFKNEVEFPITMLDHEIIYAKWEPVQDYIGMAVEASMTEVQNDYLKYVDVAEDKADNRFVDASDAFALSKFTFSDTIDKEDTRTQKVDAELTLAANFHRDAIINAAYYAGAVTVGAVVRRAEVKAFVDPYIDEINEWFKENSIREVISNVDREAIIDSVYEALKNRVDDIWENFRDEDGVYYTGGVYLSAGDGQAYRVELPNKSINKTAYAKEMAKIAAHLAVDLTKDIYHEMSVAREWSDFVEIKGTLTFTFDDSAAYEAYTQQFPHVYPFEITMTLDGNGYVFYKFDEYNVPHVKLFIDQKTQDRYDAAVKLAVDKVVTNDYVINFMRSEMNKLINKYIDLNDPNNPFASDIPEEVTTSDKAVLNGALRGIVKAWFYNNSNISLTNSENDGDIRDSYFYKRIWLGEDVTRDDSVFLTLADSDIKVFNDKIREIAIREAKEQAPDKLSEAVSDAQVEFDTNILPTINTNLKNALNNKIKESVKNAYAAEVRAQYSALTGLDPADPAVDAYVASATATFVASPEYNEAVNDFIASPEYEEALAEVVQTPEYAALMDTVLDRIFEEVEDTINGRFTHYSYTYVIAPVRASASISNWATVLENALVNDTALINALAINEVDKMIANDDLPTADIIVDTITDLIDNTKYMEFLSKATNIRRFDTIDDITLDNLATALGNETAQKALASQISDKRESYLVRLADQLRRLPEGASIVVTNATTGEDFVINAALVDDVRDAETIEEICDAFAAIFALDGIKDMSLSEFYDGQLVSFKYKTHSASFGLWVEAE